MRQRHHNQPGTNSDKDTIRRYTHVGKPRSQEPSAPQLHSCWSWPAIIQQLADRYLSTSTTTPSFSTVQRGARSNRPPGYSTLPATAPARPRPRTSSTSTHTRAISRRSRRGNYYSAAACSCQQKQAPPASAMQGSYSSNQALDDAMTPPSPTPPTHLLPMRKRPLSLHYPLIPTHQDQTKHPHLSAQSPTGCTPASATSIRTRRIGPLV